MEEKEVLEVREREREVRRLKGKTISSRKEISTSTFPSQSAHESYPKLTLTFLPSEIEVPKVRCPHISLKSLMFLRPSTKLVEISKTTLLHPRIKARPLKESILPFKVSNPVSINIFKPIYLRVSIKEPSEISIRPLIEANFIRPWEKVKVSLKISPFRLRGLPLKEAIKLSSILIKPRIALALRLEKEVESILLSKVVEGAKVIEETAETEPSPYSPEVFGLPEGLLDVDSELIKGGALSSIRPEGPICIVSDKTRGFDEFVELLCSILYRIKSGGLPSVWTYGSVTETFSAYRSRQDITILEGVRKSLEEVIQKVKSGQSMMEQAQSLSKTFKDLRLERAFRFIVLPAKAEDFKTIKEILTNPQSDFRYYIPVLHFYKLKELEDEQFTAILQAMFGFLRPFPHTINIGRQCLELESQFYRRLEEIVNEIKRRLPSQLQPVAGDELGQEESWLHYALKFLVIKHLIDNCRESVDSIETEEVIYGNVRADVLYNKMIAVEIETFYGTILPFERKLVPKLKGYSGFQGQLWLVIPNIQALLYVDDLLKLRKDYRGEGMKLEIYTLDLTGNGGKVLYDKQVEPGLVKFVDVLKWLRRNGLERHQKFLQIEK